MVSTPGPAEVGYFEDLREMPAAGPFVVCRLLNGRYAVEVAPPLGHGCPKVPFAHVILVLEDAGRGRGNYPMRESAIASAEMLNDLFASGSLNPWSAPLSTTTHRHPTEGPHP